MKPVKTFEMDSRTVFTHSFDIVLDRKLKKKLFGTRKSRKKKLKAMQLKESEDVKKMYEGYFDRVYREKRDC